MIRLVGKTPEKLARYDQAQKVVFSVITAGVTVYIATSLVSLRNPVGGQAQGIQLSSTSGQIALDVQGDIYWSASAEGVQVEVLEAGAL